MNNIIKVLLTVFPELRETDITPDLSLDNIPGWDSMNAINLQLELESIYKIDLSREALPGEMTVAQLENRIKVLTGE